MDAAVYCRISHVNDESTIGVDRQEADGRALVEARGWNLAAVRVDNNMSAWRRNRKRPGWDALLEDIREHRVDAVVVAHPDRLMRQPRDLEDLLDSARDSGVQLVSAGAGRDLSSPDDVFILRIEVAHACRSSDDTSRRVRRGHQAAAEEGRPGGGTGKRRPYGYTADQLEVVPSERAVVQDCARKVIAGQSLSSIVRELNDQQVPTVSGARWSLTALRGILTAARTAGLREYRGEIVGGAVWPPLLDRETWENVRQLTVRTAPAGQNRRKYLLSGLILCPCGARFQARSGEPPGYKCVGCHQRIARHHLEEYVSERVLEVLNDPRALARFAPPASPEDETDRELVAACEARVKRILDEWESTGASAEWVRGKVEQINGEKQAAQRRIAARARRSTLSDLAGLPRGAWDRLPLGVQRTVVGQLFPNLTVRRGRMGKGFDEQRVLLRGLG